MLKTSLSVATYLSDLGLEFKNVRFSQKAGVSCNGIEYGTPIAAPCPPPRYFKMRRLKAIFSGEVRSERKGVVAEYPLPDVTLMPAFVKALLDCGALCIDLIGEEWTLIPPNMSDSVRYTPTYDLIPLVEERKAYKVTGRMSEYQSDAGINGKPKFAIELLPQAFAEKALGGLQYLAGDDVWFPTDPSNTPCLGAVEKSSICTIADQIPRKLIVRGNSILTVNEVPDANSRPRVWNRAVPVSSRTGIGACIRSIGSYPGVQCVSYKGESIKNIHLLIANSLTTA